MKINLVSELESNTRTRQATQLEPQTNLAKITEKHKPSEAFCRTVCERNFVDEEQARSGQNFAHTHSINLPAQENNKQTPGLMTCCCRPAGSRAAPWLARVEDQGRLACSSPSDLVAWLALSSCCC